MKNDLQYLKTFLFFVVPIFVIHLLVFQIPYFQIISKNFYFSIPFLYLLFTIFSKTIIFIVTKVSQISFDNTGMVFMIATFVKTGICYLILKPVIDIQNNNPEKLNVFLIFICFLTIETLITIRILNKKQ